MDIKKTIFKIAMIAMITSYFATVYLFYGAYFYKDKYIIVAIDFFGEADIEAILLFITMPCVIYFLIANRDAIIHMDFKVSTTEKISGEKMEDKEIRYELNRLSVQIGELQQDIKVVANALLDQQKFGQLHSSTIDDLTKIGK